MGDQEVGRQPWRAHGHHHARGLPGDDGEVARLEEELGLALHGVRHLARQPELDAVARRLVAA